MSVEHRSRIEGIVKAHLKKVALGQAHGFAVSYGFGPIFTPDGQPQGMGWMWGIIISIPNPLVGQPDIAVSVPVQGVLPPDAAFQAVAEFLFNKCLEERDKLLTTPAPGPSMKLSERPA